MSALIVVQNLLQYLLFTLAPILPHLTEEVTLHHPTSKDWRIFHQKTSGAPLSWNQPEIASAVEKCLTVRRELYRTHPDMVPHSTQVYINAGGHIFEALKIMQSSEGAEESGLCELLQAARVILQKDEEEGFTIQVMKSEKCKCLRCRKVTANAGEKLCSRCHTVITSNW